MNFFPYMGGKYRSVSVIKKYLHDTGASCVVDVFGGSGAIAFHSGFKKRIYNDINGDLVNLCRVMSNPLKRRQLLKLLRWTFPSREIFNSDYDLFVAGDYSFKDIQCPLDRARKTLYRLIFCFGGKYTTGGYAICIADSKYLKEVGKYTNVLRNFSNFGKFFLNTVIENLDFVDLINKYSGKEGVVFFIDPPYLGFSRYYVNTMDSDRHFELSSLLVSIPETSICTFYDLPIVRKIYSSKYWNYHNVSTFRNSVSGGVNRSDELLLVRKPFNSYIHPPPVVCSNQQKTFNFN